MSKLILKEATREKLSVVNADAENNIEIFQSDHRMSRAELLAMIERETRSKYPHLSPRFYPDHCMQAKVTIPATEGSLLNNAPEDYIEILRSENFFAETFSHHLSHCDGRRDGQQYVLVNTELAKIGYQFVMKVTFGPNFLSVWFRNESRNERIDLPVFYALEILNKIHHKFMAAAAVGGRDQCSPDSQTLRAASS